MKFEKVSYEQFKKDIIDTFNMEDDYKINPSETEGFIKDTYNNIKLPKRATTGSAGYDFFSPLNIYLKPNETFKIPTGIRVSLDEDKVLMCFPRSGLGFKYRLQLDNTVGIIDADYYYANNEGHIMLKITNDGKSDKKVFVDKGEGFAQGIIVQYFKTDDDDSIEKRTGGFGSTTKK